MFKRLALAMALMFGLGLAAQDTSNINVRDLSKEQQAQLILKAEEMRKEGKGGGILAQGTSPEQMSKWLGLGKEVADLIPIFAEKTGIAADKVLNSFSGKVLLSIVLVHFFWTKLVGLFLVTVGPAIWWKWFRKMFLLVKQETLPHPNKVLAYLGLSKTYSTYSRIGETVGSHADAVETVWLGVAIISLGVCVVSGVIALFA